jgi:hypothetical protein
MNYELETPRFVCRGLITVCDEFDRAQRAGITDCEPPNMVTTRDRLALFVTLDRRFSSSFIIHPSSLFYAQRANNPRLPRFDVVLRYAEPVFLVERENKGDELSIADAGAEFAVE